ncbi:MAG TPA: gas vesicle protein GvpG [Gaiellaceae bacterium]|jgi:hypothetical protein|nr:gas vesicle protein GvpG [Gaiellaceae bacterium]
MGLLTGLITFPLAPVRGTVWIAERLLEEAERELNDPEVVEQQLLDAEARHERGEITDDELEQIEDELLRRLGGW